VAIPAPTVSHVTALLETHLPDLLPAQRRGLAQWVVGVLAAKSGCQSAVVSALAPLGEDEAATRQRLREWLYDGSDRAAPCQTRVDVSACFAPLLRWVLSWWQDQTLPLAVDATSLGERTVVVAVSVLYRGTAIPVAWAVFPDKGRGPWIPAVQQLLQALAPAVPPTLTVLVMTDRGLWSPRLWRSIKANGWHPLMRIRPEATFAPAGQRRQRARELVAGAGQAWVGEGVAYKDKARRLDATLVVVWEDGQEEPWLLLTDLPAAAVDVRWYGLRVWIELGFRALKSFGWDWQRTRRTDPARIARHWLVLAVATLWTVAVGTRVEDAVGRGLAPAPLRAPRPPRSPTPHPPRRSSVFRRGLDWLHAQVLRGARLWRRLWLAPDPLPALSPTLLITRHLCPMGTAHAAYLPL
jgi:Transposase DDE domain